MYFLRHNPMPFFLLKGKFMYNIKEAMKLYAVTDRRWAIKDSFEKQVQAAITGGITCLQLREKNMSEIEFLHEAIKMKTLCKSIPLIINDNIEIAIKSNADGVHIGQHDTKLLEAREKLGPKKIIGVSTQTVKQALLAEKNGADYLGVGAVFATSTKDNAKPLDHDILKAITNAVSIPVVAIGGITKDNLEVLQGTGIDGTAVVSAIFSKPDIKQATQDLLSRVEGII